MNKWSSKCEKRDRRVARTDSLVGGRLGGLFITVQLLSECTCHRHEENFRSDPLWVQSTSYRPQAWPLSRLFGNTMWNDGLPRVSLLTAFPIRAPVAGIVRGRGRTKIKQTTLDALRTRQSLVKGERLVRHEMRAVLKYKMYRWPVIIKKMLIWLIIWVHRVKCVILYWNTCSVPFKDCCKICEDVCCSDKDCCKDCEDVCYSDIFHSNNI